MLKLLATLILAAAVASAQTPSSVQQHYKVGDTLHYTVVFDGDADFSSVTLYFSAPTVPADQSGLMTNFSINQTKKLGPGKFEVEGTIPGNAVSGSYVLLYIQPRIAPNGVKDYDARSFHQTLEVENPMKYKFPPLKDVRPE